MLTIFLLLSCGPADGFFDSCESDDDCSSGFLCLAVNGGERCTHPCSEDADCPTTTCSIYLTVPYTCSDNGLCVDDNPC